MATTTTSNFIFLGNFVDIDTNETDWDAEDGDALLGNYQGAKMQNISVSQNDANDDRVIRDDESGQSDTLSYDTGGGQVTVQADTSAWYNAVVTDTGGTEHIVKVVVVQMTNGDAFVVDYFGSDFPLANIDTLELTSVGGTNYSGYHASATVDTAPLCFTAGTIIQTLDGPKPVEMLRIGQQIATLDNGMQTIRWIGSSYMTTPFSHAPIVFAPSSLGKGIPVQTLSVSPQHRIMVSSKIAERVTATPQILVAAKRLLEIDGVSQASADTPVQYWHILFDTHQIVFANGVPSESLLLGRQAQKALSPAALAEIAAIFPQLTRPDAPPRRSARPIPTKRGQKHVVHRHHRNSQPVLQTYPSTRV